MAETDVTEVKDDIAPIEMKEPQPEPAVTEPLPPPVAKKRGGVSALLGGVLAAGAGFGVAQYVPDGWPIADTAAFEAQIAAQATEIAALKDQIAVLANAPTLEPRIVALETAPAPDLSPLTAQIDGLAKRLDQIESLPADGSAANPAALAALADQIAALQTKVDAQGSAPASPEATALAAEAEARLKEAEAQAAQMKAEAEALAQATQARATLGRLQAALDTGTPLAPILADLGTDNTTLAAFAETGIPTLAGLQASFPEAARAALEASLRADMGDSWTERATSFLRSQTGARSLTPRDGADPDAVLSRAEAALATGDLAMVFTELSGLPEPGQAAMAAWRGIAQSRQDAIQAVADVAKNIGG